MQIRIRQMPNTAPISSRIALNMKSCDTYGIAPGLPSHSPVPSHPPAAIANSD